MGDNSIKDAKFFERKLSNDGGNSKSFPRTRGFISSPGRILVYGMACGAAFGTFVGYCLNFWFSGTDQKQEGHRHGGNNRHRR